MKLRLHSLLLLALFAARVAAQPSAFVADRQVLAVLPAEPRYLSVIDSALYLYADGLMLTAPTLGGELLPIRPDTTLVRLHPDITYATPLHHSASKGHAADTLYFTHPDRKGRSQLRMAYHDGKKLKTKQVKLDGIEVEHPTFSPDGHIMVFAARDRDRGQGGYDLWYSVREANTWSHPLNLGSHINGYAYETAPIIIGDYLFFASNSRAESGGHVHLYATRLLSDHSVGDTVGMIPIGRSPVQHLPEPFNRIGADSYSLVPDPVVGGGYFLCGGELYSFAADLHCELLFGYVREANDNPIASATVTAYLDSRPLCSTTTDRSGLYSLALPAGHRYSLVYSKANHFSHRTEVRAITDPTGDLIGQHRLDVGLDAIPIGKPIHYTDLFGPNTSSELNSHGCEVLQQLATFLTDNPALSLSLTLFSDPTTDPDFNALLTAQRLDVIHEYLRPRIPAATRLLLHNACSGSSTCADGTNTTRLTATLQ